ncbi:MAG: hypothetical protein LBS87_01660, partial [Puniceicoccales bacterium]|nr:hypothetical protein [Puniceicoccales bacterium]
RWELFSKLNADIISFRCERKGGGSQNFGISKGKDKWTGAMKTNGRAHSMKAKDSTFPFKPFYIQTKILS